MNAIVFLVIWLAQPIEQPPTFRVLGLAQSVKECEAVKDKLVSEKVEGAKRLACMQILTPMKDAGEKF